MWKLKSTKREHWEQYIFVGDECIVGRKESTLLISDDPSVSRKHAVLLVKHPEENLGSPSNKSSLFLRDNGSKYGTFKNGVRLASEEELSDGDVIKFGQFESEFRIHYIPLVITTSCLDISSKNKLKKVIHMLGGHIVSEWQPSCTHLVMSHVKVTIKALCSLVSLKFIVLPEYFTELEKKLKNSATIPPPNEFIPPIGEALIDKDKVSFDVDPQRKNIFKDKTLFFIDEKQFKKLHLGIIMGGGNATIVSEDKLDTDLLLHENSCFIEPAKGQVSKEEAKNFLKEIISALQKKNLRMIPESDIGLAVVYASTEKFCNPSFNMGAAVLGTQIITSQTLTEREVYVPDTQERAERCTSSKRSSSLSLSNQSKSKKQKLEAPDSFNLTSFRGDAEEIFEIPLSAQVKEELDNLFDETMQAVNEDVPKEKIPSTLPPEPEFIVNQVNASIHTKKEVLNKTTSPKKPKVERNTSVVNANGFSSSAMNCDDEAHLPRNLVNVQFVSLIIQRPVTSSAQKVTNSHVKNFKKFKKVLSKHAQALPRIIGGNDLVPYDKDAAKFADEKWNEDVEVRHDKPVKGAFDWDG